MALTVETTLNEIAEIHKSKPLFGHPLWTEWGAGKLSRGQLQECVKQVGIIPLHNHNYHGRLYVICPDPAWRARIAEVCYEEGTGRLYANGVSHHELYVKFAAALEISREELYATQYCSGAVAFKAYFSAVCEKDFLEGVSAHMLAAEAPVPAHGSKRADALRNHYGLTDEDVTFFSVHEVADDDHSGIGRELLSEFASTEEDFQRVLRTVAECLDMMKLMYDSIYDTVKAVN